MLIVVPTLADCEAEDEFWETGAHSDGPPIPASLFRPAYFASTIRTGLSSWKVSTVSVGTRIEPPLVST